MAIDPCDGDLSPGGASRNLREVGAFSSSKTRKTCTGFCWRPGGRCGLLEAWHLLLRGVTGHDAGDAGDGWQNLFGDGLKRPP